MKFTDGLINVQNIPGDTDFEDVAYKKEKEVYKKDIPQTPPDAVITPIDDPLYQEDQQPINENSPKPVPRIMQNYAYGERRIF